jgi:hypothetical protein
VITTVYIITQKRTGMKPLRFGYKASSEQFAPRELLEFGVLAEAYGFDSVFFSDHLQPWRHGGRHAPYALSMIAALGERLAQVTQPMPLGRVGVDSCVAGW